MTLEELIPSYGQNNTELNSYKKICADENAKIKELMKEAKIEEKTVDGWVASVRVKRTESFNENKLLDIAKSLGLTDIIKTKEYVDTDVMEELIYNGTITQEMLLEISKAQEVKETPTLYIKREKKKKGDDE
jgi:ribosomal protein S8E